LDWRTLVDLIVAAGAVGAAAFAYALGRRSRRDRATIVGLQRALTNDFPQLPGVSIGSAVLSASPGVDIGGDIVDVFALDSRFTLLLVADVCGKGVAAAAHTAFIKYTIRTLALDSDGDPAVVLAKFNALYPRTIKDTEAFVVLILGVVDAQTGEVRYASAGHEPAFVRRGDGSVTMLAPTGPIVGPAPFSVYGCESLMLGPRDVLVWTTDGMTEHREPNGRLLGTDGLANAIAAAPSGAQNVADALVGRLGRRGRGAGQDDVAILAVAFDAAPPPRSAAPERLRIAARRRGGRG
jgi:sigma-B regulation protein RsbU (phosphoserine phosphatase)